MRLFGFFISDIFQFEGLLAQHKVAPILNTQFDLRSEVNCP